MLRSRNLVPLSHQHQHVLALCVRIERTLQPGKVNADAWHAEIARDYEQEVKFHFSAEEHGRLRKHFVQAEAQAMDMTELGEFAKLLSNQHRQGRTAAVGSPRETLVAGRIGSGG